MLSSSSIEETEIRNFKRGGATMQSMKESAANMAASAKAGMEKTKATVQETVDKMAAKDPLEKEMATERKEERQMQAEIHKQEAFHHNAAATGGGTGAGTGYATENFSHSMSGDPGHPTGAQQMSVLPRHGAGQPAGQVFGGATETNPVGLNSGTTNDPPHNTRIGGGVYGTGGSYT